MKNLNLIIKKVLNEQTILNEVDYLEKRIQKKCKGVCKYGFSDNSTYVAKILDCPFYQDGSKWCSGNRILPDNWFERKIQYNNGKIDKENYSFYKFGWMTDASFKGKKVVTMWVTKPETMYYNIFDCGTGRISYKPDDAINNEGVNKAATEAYEASNVEGFCNKINWSFKKPKKKKQKRSEATWNPM